MLELNLTILAVDEAEVELTLEEACRSIKGGNVSGSGKREDSTGAYYFSTREKPVAILLQEGRGYALREFDSFVKSKEKFDSPEALDERLEKLEGSPPLESGRSDFLLRHSEIGRKYHVLNHCDAFDFLKGIYSDEEQE